MIGLRSSLQKYEKSYIGKDLLFPARLLFADTPNLFFEENIRFEVPAANLDQLPIVAFLLGVPLITGTGQRGEEQIIQALKLLELIA
jgi:hypothetical protein